MNPPTPGTPSSSSATTTDLGPATEWQSRGYLPHRDRLGLLQSITFRLADSLPQSKLAALEAEIKSLAPKHKDTERRKRIEQWLDSGLGCCALAHPKVAACVENALLHFDHERYRLLAWCIMPSHVHVLIEPLTPLSTIIQSWKSYTGRWALEKNAELELRVPGNTFWMRDYWDRFIRNEKHLQNVIEYIHQNPVTAKLCPRPEQWQWSSYHRTPPGTPSSSSALKNDFIAPKCHEQIELLYQDNDILIINKPSGLLSLSGKNPANKDSVHFRLLKDFPTALMIHRLDLGTSGIILLALNKPTSAKLNQQFKERSVRKTYTALLHGKLAEKQGTIDIPIIKDKENFPYQKVCYTTGKPSQSSYQLINYNPDTNISRVIFKPLTGRTHQLRIHSQHFGHSILGCDLYASKEIGAMAKRLMLHATTLDFIHPTTNEPMAINCPCPF